MVDADELRGAKIAHSANPLPDGRDDIGKYQTGEADSDQTIQVCLRCGAADKHYIPVSATADDRRSTAPDCRRGGRGVDDGGGGSVGTRDEGVT